MSMANSVPLQGSNGPACFAALSSLEVQTLSHTVRWPCSVVQCRRLFSASLLYFQLKKAAHRRPCSFSGHALHVARGTSALSECVCCSESTTQWIRCQGPPLSNWDVFLQVEYWQGISEHNGPLESWKNTAVKRTPLLSSPWAVNTVKTAAFETHTWEMSFFLVIHSISVHFRNPCLIMSRMSYFRAHKIVWRFVQDYIVNNWFVPHTIFFF